MQIDLTEDEVGLLWSLAITEAFFPRLPEKRYLAGSAASRLSRALFSDDAPASEVTVGSH